MTTKNCISVHGVNHELELMQSDCIGFYMYKATPLELGYESKVIYIAPNRESHWLFGKPMQGGKLIDSRNISYFKRIK